MPKQTRKCDFCKVDDTNKEDMEVVVKEGKEGKRPTYKYYHKDTCYERFLKRQAFREQERKELDDLSNVIMKIYGAKVLPNAIFPMLQDLRNGTKFYGRQEYKYKQGYSYHVIARTFEYVSDSIEYANAHKNFSGGFTQAFRYGLAIVCDKLMIVEKKLADEQMQEKRIENHVKAVSEKDQLYDSSYKPKEKKKLDFLDD